MFKNEKYKKYKNSIVSEIKHKYLDEKYTVKNKDKEFAIIIKILKEYSPGDENEFIKNI